MTKIKVLKTCSGNLNNMIATVSRTDINIDQGALSVRRLNLNYSGGPLSVRRLNLNYYLHLNLNFYPHFKCHLYRFAEGRNNVNCSEILIVLLYIFKKVVKHVCV
jgi:hypothetical protein